MSSCNPFVSDINIDLGPQQMLRPAYIQETQRLKAERLVHSEVKSN